MSHQQQDKVDNLSQEDVQIFSPSHKEGREGANFPRKTSHEKTFTEKLKETAYEAAEWISEAVIPKTEQGTNHGKEVVTSFVDGKLDYQAVSDLPRPDFEEQQYKKQSSITKDSTQVAEDMKEDVKEMVGQAAEWVKETVQPESKKSVGQKTKEVAHDVKENIKDTADDVRRKVKPESMKTGGEATEDTVKELEENVREAVGNAADWIKEKVTPESQKTVGDKAKEGYRHAKNEVKEKANDAADWVNEKVTPESQKTVGDKAKEGYRHAKNEVKDKANDAADWVKEKVTPESEKTVSDKAKEGYRHAKNEIKEKADDAAEWVKEKVTPESQKTVDDKAKEGYRHAKHEIKEKANDAADWAEDKKDKMKGGHRPGKRAPKKRGTQPAERSTERMNIERKKSFNAEAKEFDHEAAEEVAEKIGEAADWVKDKAAPEGKKGSHSKKSKREFKKKLGDVMDRAHEHVEHSKEHSKTEVKATIGEQLLDIASDVKDNAAEMLGEAAGWVKEKMIPENDKNAGDKMEEKFQHGKRELKNKAHEFTEKAKDTADDVKRAVKPEDQKTLGEKATDVVYELNDHLAEAIGNAAGWVQEHVTPESEKTASDKIEEKFQHGKREVKDKANDAADWVKEKVTPESQKTVGDKAKEGYRHAKGEIKEKAEDAAEWVKEKVTPESQKRVGDKAKEGYRHAKNDIKDKANDAADWVKEKVTPESEKTVGDKAKEGYRHAKNEIKEKTDDAAEWVKEKVTPESQKTVGDKAQEGYRHAKNEIKDKANDAADRVKEAVKPESKKSFGEKTKEVAHDAKEKIKDTADDVKRAVKPESKKTLGEKVTDLAVDLKDNAGEMLGDATDWVKEKITPESEKTVGDKAKEGYRHAKEQVKDTADDVKRELKPESKQTLGDKVADLAYDLKDKAGDLMDDAKEWVDENLLSNVEMPAPEPDNLAIPGGGAANPEPQIPRTHIPSSQFIDENIRTEWKKTKSKAEELLAQIDQTLGAKHQEHREETKETMASKPNQRELQTKASRGGPDKSLAEQIKEKANEVSEWLQSKLHDGSGPRSESQLRAAEQQWEEEASRQAQEMKSHSHENTTFEEHKIEHIKSTSANNKEYVTMSGRRFDDRTLQEKIQMEGTRVEGLIKDALDPEKHLNKYSNDKSFGEKVAEELVIIERRMGEKLEEAHKKVDEEFKVLPPKTPKEVKIEQQRKEIDEALKKIQHAMGDLQVAQKRFELQAKPEDQKTFGEKFESRMHDLESIINRSALTAKRWVGKTFEPKRYESLEELRIEDKKLEDTHQTLDLGTDQSFTDRMMNKFNTYGEKIDSELEKAHQRIDKLFVVGPPKNSHEQQVHVENRDQKKEILTSGQKLSTAAHNVEEWADKHLNEENFKNQFDKVAEKLGDKLEDLHQKVDEKFVAEPPNPIEKAEKDRKTKIENDKREAKKAKKELKKMQKQQKQNEERLAELLKPDEEKTLGEKITQKVHDVEAKIHSGVRNAENWADQHLNEENFKQTFNKVSENIGEKLENLHQKVDSKFVVDNEYGNIPHVTIDLDDYHYHQFQERKSFGEKVDEKVHEFQGKIKEVAYNADQWADQHLNEQNLKMKFNKVSEKVGEKLESLHQKIDEKFIAQAPDPAEKSKKDWKNKLENDKREAKKERRRQKKQEKENRKIEARLAEINKPDDQKTLGEKITEKFHDIEEKAEMSAYYAEQWADKHLNEENFKKKFEKVTENVGQKLENLHQKVDDKFIVGQPKLSKKQRRQQAKRLKELDQHIAAPLQHDDDKAFDEMLDQDLYEHQLKIQEKSQHPDNLREKEFLAKGMAFEKNH